VKPVKKFNRFGEVMKEIKISGVALYEDKGNEELVILSPYRINYIHSYAQDSKFFLGLADGKLYGSVCKKCGYKYGTPRSHCMECGSETDWFELPNLGKVHSWTTCYFGSEEFLKETPFNLVVVEFEGVNTLFLSRLIGAEQSEIYTGMPVKANFLKDPRYLVSDVYFTAE
jgi:uncharacterized OB-fold protein